jgi:hypothetical protein
VSRNKGLTAAEVRERVPSDPSLACPIDNRLFRDAVKTPCCGTVYCEECIQTHLLERDFICPSCAKKIPSLDKLEMDKPARMRVNDYIEKAIEESKKDGGEDDQAKVMTGSNQVRKILHVFESNQVLKDHHHRTWMTGRVSTWREISTLISRRWIFKCSSTVYHSCKHRYLRYL